MFYYLLTLVIVLICIAAKRYNKRIISPTGFKSIPYVEESYYPFVGNGIGFSKDIIGFIRKAYQKYGGIFRLKIFRKELVVICDRTLVKDFFSAREDVLSMYNVLEDLFLRDAFAGKQKTSFTTIITIIKKTITVRYDEFCPKIIDEATKLVNRMKNDWVNKDEVNLTDIVIKFIANTSARCFIAMELSNEFYTIFINFTHLLNKIIVATYFLPKWFLKMTGGMVLKSYWSQMVKLLLPEIKKYRDDPKKKDSLVFRTAVDFVEESGAKLNDDQIGGIVIGLLYVSSENSALGLASTIVDLATHSEHWNKVGALSQGYLEKKDFDGLFNDPYIDACVTETCRMGSHIFAINRKPVSGNMVLNDYFLGEVDTVALCQPMLMLYDCADDIYSNPTKYNPERFLGDKKESKLSHNLLTFGSGSHLCPGKGFAILEIKTAIAMITTQFERFELPDPLPELFYFSPSAFAEREIHIKIHPLKERFQLVLEKKNEMIPFKFGSKECIIERIKGIDQSGWILRNFLNRDEQEKMYTTFVMSSQKSGSHQAIEKHSPKAMFPISYYNLAYVENPNNCEYPEELIDWAQNIWNSLNGSLIPLIDLPPLNSAVGQLYGTDTVLPNHYDQGVSWGLSVSLGGSCQFVFDDQVLTINGGDILITDFSKVLHGIQSVTDNAPGWMTEEIAFGRTRLSIQIKAVDREKSPAPIPLEDFYKMLESYEIK